MHTLNKISQRLMRAISAVCAVWLASWVTLGGISIERVSAASSWSPALIVNTEAFQSIDDSDTSANIVLRFGDTINKTLTYNRSLARFQFDDDLYITGGLDVTGTISGATLYGTKSLRSSGSLVFEGAASGSSLYLGTSLKGAGLSDCDTSNTSKLLWDATTGRFSCGTDQTGGSGSPEVGTTPFSGGVLRLGDPHYVNVSGDTMTGTLHIRKAITGAASGALTVDQRTNQTGAYIGTTSNQAPAAAIDAAGTATSPHIVFGYQGTFDSTLYRSAASTLRTNAAFIVDGSLTFGDAIGDTITANAAAWTFANDTNFALSGGVNGLSFDTDTLSIDATNNRIGIGTTAPDTTLETVGTMSGSIIYGTVSVRSSGSLVVEGASTFNSTATFQGTAGSNLLTLGDTNNSDSVSLRTGTGNPNGSVSAELASLFFASDTGKIWKNNNGATQWLELTAGSGTLHMAKISRTSAQSIPAGTFVKMYFDTEDIDIGDIADVTPGATGSGRITIKKAGKYLVTASWAPASSLVENNVIAIDLYKNNSAIARIGSASDLTAPHVQLTEVVDLAVNDYLELKVFQPGTGAKDTNAGILKPRFAVIQIQDNTAANYWTMSGSNIFGNQAGNVGIGTTRPASKLAVSGSVIISNRGNLDTVSADAHTALEVVGMMSGSVVFGNTSLRSSGSLVWEGAASGNTLSVSGNASFAEDLTFGNAINDAITVNAASWTFANATNFAVTNAANALSIDTDTFSVDALNNRIGIRTTAPDNPLEVVGTISGSVVYGNASLRSSGSLVWEGAGSGASLYLGGSLQGVGLTDCDTGATSKLLWDASTGRFSCGTDQTGGAGSPEVGTASFSGGVVRVSDGRYVNTSGDTMTGVLTVQNGNTHAATATPLINTRGTMSGVTVYANSQLRSSGSLAVEGTTAFRGVQYTWPGAAASSSGKVLKVNPANGQLSWSDDSTGGGGGPSTVVSTANVSDSTTGGTNNVTGLTIPVSASTNYIIRCLLTTNAATTTTGVQITVNGPAAPSQITWQRQSCSSTTALVNANINAFGTEDARTASAGATRCIEPINIHLRNNGTAGNVTFSVDTEIASSAVTVYQGSFCDYQSY